MNLTQAYVNHVPIYVLDFAKRENFDWLYHKQIEFDRLFRNFYGDRSACNTWRAGGRKKKKNYYDFPFFRSIQTFSYASLIHFLKPDYDLYNEIKIYFYVDHMRLHFINSNTERRIIFYAKLLPFREGEIRYL